jgi:hypothetical protein
MLSADCRSSANRYTAAAHLPALLFRGKQQLPRTTGLPHGVPWSGLVGGKLVLVVAKEASICVGTGT